eukprot:gene16113-biopygen20245
MWCGKPALAPLQAPLSGASGVSDISPPVPHSCGVVRIHVSQKKSTFPTVRASCAVFTAYEAGTVGNCRVFFYTLDPNLGRADRHRPLKTRVHNPRAETCGLVSPDRRWTVGPLLRPINVIIGTLPRTTSSASVDVGYPETVVGKLDYPEAIRIICVPGACACGGSDRGAKAGIPKSFAPTCDNMQKNAKYRKNTESVRDPTTRCRFCLNLRAEKARSCLIRRFRQPERATSGKVHRDSRWEAGPTSGPILRAGGGGRAARGADLRAGMRPGEFRKSSAPPPTHGRGVDVVRNPRSRIAV